MDDLETGYNYKKRSNEKMKKRNVFSALLALAMVLSLAACGNKPNPGSGSGNGRGTPNSGDSGSKVVLKVGNTVSEKDPFSICLAEFEKEVEEASGGSIDVQLFINGSIAGTDADVLDKVRANTLQMGHTTPNCLAALVNMPEYYVYGIPYLMSSDEELNTVAESEWINGVNESFRTASGVKVFPGGGVNMGWFGFSATGKQLDSISDVAGMSIRINQTNQMIALAEGAGINPQFIAFSEVYTALAQGTVDGMVTNAPLFYSNGFYDQLKSILTTHCGESYHFYIINDQFYSSLSSEQQKVLDEAVVNLIAKTRKMEETYLAEAVSAMTDAGVTVKEASAADEEFLANISREKIWWDPNTSLTTVENENNLLEILGRTEERQ